MYNITRYDMPVHSYWNHRMGMCLFLKFIGEILR